MLKTEAQPLGWWDTLKETFSFDYLRNKFDLSIHNLIEISAYIGAGFVCGFFIKKYGRYVLAIFLIAVLTIGLLSHIEIVHFDWEKAKALVGFSKLPEVTDMWSVYSNWMKEHVLVAVSAVIGFLIGYRVG